MTKFPSMRNKLNAIKKQLVVTKRESLIWSINEQIKVEIIELKILFLSQKQNHPDIAESNHCRNLF